MGEQRQQRGCEVVHAAATASLRRASGSTADMLALRPAVVQEVGVELQHRRRRRDGRGGRRRR